MGRPADRTRLIVKELRELIVRGELPPGSQLPTRVEIERQYGAGANTVQRALETLRRDGLVQVSGRSGTFVSLSPPHLNRYAMIFEDHPDSPGWLRYWTTLSNEIIRLERAQERPDALRLPIYHGISAAKNSTGYRQLLHEIQSHLLAGLIFVNTPAPVLGTPILEEPNVPRVAIMSSGPVASIPRVILDNGAFRRRALDYLMSQGRRRPAILSNVTPGVWRNEWARDATGRGLQIESFWLHSVHLAFAESAREIVHLLFSGPRSAWPDSLVVTDDNLVEHAAAGLIAAGVRVPSEVEIVAHCNFPWQVPSVLPTKRLGFEARKVVAACIASIDQQRRREFPVSDIQIEPCFEDELQ